MERSTSLQCASRLGPASERGGGGGGEAGFRKLGVGEMGGSSRTAGSLEISVPVSAASASGPSL